MHRFSLVKVWSFLTQIMIELLLGKKETNNIFMAIVARLITGNSCELLPLSNQWLTLNDLGVFHLNITEASWKS